MTEKRQGTSLSGWCIDGHCAGCQRPECPHHCHRTCDGCPFTACPNCRFQGGE